MCLFMAGLILMEQKTPVRCPLSILMTYWGEPFYFLWMRMERERERATITDHVNTISQDKISREDQLTFQTLRILDVVTTYLLNGKVGR